MEELRRRVAVVSGAAGSMGGALAHALAGQILAVNLFDQPNVEPAKIRARSMIEAYLERGRLPSLDPDLELGGIEIFFHPKPKGGIRLTTPVEVLKHFIASIPEDGYLAIHAYLVPLPEVEAALNELHARLQRLTLRPITIGFGPRFLHSTGQLHKGDSATDGFSNSRTAAQSVLRSRIKREG
jgi:NAD(P)-dependent dehydrogenase (short-subunit alcohol dehydrogenase family)